MAFEVPPVVVGGIAIIAVVALILSFMAVTKKSQSLPDYKGNGLSSQGVLQTSRYFDGVQKSVVSDHLPQAKYTPAQWRTESYARGTPIYTSEVRKILKEEMPSGQSPPYARAMIFTYVPWVTPDGSQVMQRAHYEGSIMARNGGGDSWTPWKIIAS